MWLHFFFGSPSELITLPKDNRPELMWMDSEKEKQDLTPQKHDKQNAWWHKNCAWRCFCKKIQILKCAKYKWKSKWKIWRAYCLQWTKFSHSVSLAMHTLALQLISLELALQFGLISAFRDFFFFNSIWMQELNSIFEISSFWHVEKRPWNMTYSAKRLTSQWKGYKWWKLC